MLVARLCEVKENGSSWLVTQGALNLTQRHGNHQTHAMDPGKRTPAKFDLDFAAHRFSAGSRIRLCLQTGCFPRLWPSPNWVTLGVHTGGSSLALPQLTGQPRQVELPPPKQQSTPDLEFLVLPSYTLTFEDSSAEIVVTTTSQGGRARLMTSAPRSKDTPLTATHCRFQILRQLEWSSPTTSRSRAAHGLHEYRPASLSRAAALSCGSRHHSRPTTGALPSSAGCSTKSFRAEGSEGHHTRL